VQARWTYLLANLDQPLAGIAASWRRWAWTELLPPSTSA
jgi:hypothetical protein